MMDVAEAWRRMVPSVHAQYPKLLAEMFAMTMATANLTLGWSLVSHYMVSAPGTASPTEAWAWVQDIAVGPSGASAVCAGADATTLPFATRGRSRVALPTVLHYCQRYKLAEHAFLKRKIEHDFFKCGGSPMPFDIKKILARLKQPPVTSETLRTAFMLCHLVPMVNAALAIYQQEVCGARTLV